jgi:hypothetical protein
MPLIEVSEVSILDGETCHVDEIAFFKKGGKGSFVELTEAELDRLALLFSINVTHEGESRIVCSVTCKTAGKTAVFSFDRSAWADDLLRPETSSPVGYGWLEEVVGYPIVLKYIVPTLDSCSGSTSHLLRVSGYSWPGEEYRKISTQIVYGSQKMIKESLLSLFNGVEVGDSEFPIVGKTRVDIDCKIPLSTNQVITKGMKIKFMEAAACAVLTH